MVGCGGPNVFAVFLYVGTMYSVSSVCVIYGKFLEQSRYKPWICAFCSHKQVSNKIAQYKMALLLIPRLIHVLIERKFTDIDVSSLWCVPR